METTMGTRNIRIDLGHVDFDSLETDDDFRREAQRILPKAIVQLGEAVGEKAWTATQKGLKGPGIKLSTSSSDKRQTKVHPRIRAKLQTRNQHQRQKGSRKRYHPAIARTKTIGMIF